MSTGQFVLLLLVVVGGPALGVITVLVAALLGVGATARRNQVGHRPAPPKRERQPRRFDPHSN